MSIDFIVSKTFLIDVSITLDVAFPSVSIKKLMSSKASITTRQYGDGVIRFISSDI